MLGLFGIFKRHGSTVERNKKIITQMLSAMNPRPDYIVDTFCHSDAALGRISQGVFNNDPQPIYDSERRYILFMDGQIFDYNHLKTQLKGEGFIFVIDSEEEVVLNMFIKYGVNAVKHLKGVFLIIIFDLKTAKLYVMTSRYGQEYFYYYLDSKEMIFSSSIKAILATGRVPKNVNKEAIYDFFKFEFITGDKTFFKDIKLFPYASTLRIDREKHQFTRYWDYPKEIINNENTKKNIDDLVDEGSFLLRQAISRHLKKNIRPGVTLSGGLDSRAISAYLAQLGKEVNAFHVAGGRDNSLETKSAKAVCDALRGKWNFYDLGDVDFEKIIPEGISLSDGHISSNQFWLLDCFKKLGSKKEVNYILDGFVMDVLLQPLFIKKPDKLHYSMGEKIDIINKTFGCQDYKFMRSFFSDKFYSSFLQSNAESISKNLNSFGSDDISCITQFFHFTNRARRFVLGMPIVNRTYVEYGFPGLDYDLFDFGLSLPLDYRLKGKLYRKIITRDFPKLGNIPWPLTGLPLNKWNPSIIKRKKRLKHYFYYISRITKGRFEVFPPHDLNYRFRKDANTRKFFLNIMQDERTASRGFIDKKGINKLIQHQDSGRNYISAMQLIVTVELWFRNFVDAN